MQIKSEGASRKKAETNAELQRSHRILVWNIDFLKNIVFFMANE